VDWKKKGKPKGKGERERETHGSAAAGYVARAVGPVAAALLARGRVEARLGTAEDVLGPEAVRARGSGLALVGLPDC
jgi:hypothetical protein